MKDDVVISLELDYLFDNKEADGLMESLDDLEADQALRSSDSEDGEMSSDDIRSELPITKSDRLRIAS